MVMDIDGPTRKYLVFKYVLKLYLILEADSRRWDRPRLGWMYAWHILYACPVAIWV